MTRLSAAIVLAIAALPGAAAFGRAAAPLRQPLSQQPRWSAKFRGSGITRPMATEPNVSESCDLETGKGCSVADVRKAREVGYYNDVSKSRSEAAQKINAQYNAMKADSEEGASKEEPKKAVTANEVAKTATKEPVKDAKAVEAKKKSALILGWFYAEPRQLKFVARMYKKKGYDDVVTCESDVNVVSKPKGWYKACLQTQNTMNQDGGHPLAREFDTVHVMSGGFLNLYQLLFAGVKIDFKTLVLDSTPILPKPAAFTRFARAYMDSVGLTIIPKLIPSPIHQAFVAFRWSLQSVYIKIQHQILRLMVVLGRRKAASDQMKKLNSQANLSLTNRYVPIIDDVVATVFKNSGVEKAVFVYNPDDPFINSADVDSTMEGAKGAGVEVVAAPTPGVDHVQTLFKKPDAIWGNIA